ncbi:MAG TPA: DUF3891 family protein [Candidatus Acidoferrales bacterium]|jgi:hypothetical protein|nr:DUF3891 family protein [Candidatus Acidoferrales bacterium]
MLRLETETGWWLVTHPDHARLAGAFAERWGNDMFLPPEPRARVLKGIATHDDGWAVRDAKPQITRQGKPSAFSVELVGKYSAFEEIDLADYLAVRDRAVRLIAAEDPYAALLVSMHTYSLLSEHADRSTIAAAELPLLDKFLEQQKEFQRGLRNQIEADASVRPEHKSEAAIFDHFRLLQANDNLSLVTCVDFSRPTNLLHPLPLRGGGYTRVEVRSLGPRQFVLDPFPFRGRSQSFDFPARHVKGKLFASAEELAAEFAAAPIETQTVTVSAP